MNKIFVHVPHFLMPELISIACQLVCCALLMCMLCVHLYAFMYVYGVLLLLLRNHVMNVIQST